MLLEAGFYPGAYYLVGYAIECALKSCVAKQIRRFDFPDKKLAIEAYTHDLEKLVRVAGLAPEFERERAASPALELNWGSRRTGRSLPATIAISRRAKHVTCILPVREGAACCRG